MVQLSNPLKFGTGLWDPSHRFETSWLLPPYVLCGIRALFVRPLLCFFPPELVLAATEPMCRPKLTT